MLYRIKLKKKLVSSLFNEEKLTSDISSSQIKKVAYFAQIFCRETQNLLYQNMSETILFSYLFSQKKP